MYNDADHFQPSTKTSELKLCLFSWLEKKLNMVYSRKKWCTFYNFSDFFAYILQNVQVVTNSLVFSKIPEKNRNFDCEVSDFLVF